MKLTEESIIGKIVAEDYRTAAVFQSFDMDFCCQGNRTLGQSCEERNIKPEVLKTALQAVMKQQNNVSIDYRSWPLDLLVDYIEKKHHRYVEDQIPALKQYLHKVCQVHGKQHPELLEIAMHFNQAAGELTKHMKKEEFILFPFVRKMVAATKAKQEIGDPHFATVQNPIQMMMQEHNEEGKRFRKIARLSNNYVPPEDVCNTYRVTYSLLKEFEKDLHQHIHLENNILFPKSVELEQQLANAKNSESKD